MNSLRSCIFSFAFLKCYKNILTRILFIVFALLVIDGEAIAQNKVDLRKKSNKIEIDRKIDILFLQAENAKNENKTEDAEQYLNSSLKLATENNLSYKKKVCQYHLGDLYNDAKNYSLATSYYNTGLSLSMNDKNPEHKIRFTEKLAAVNLLQKKYKETEEYYHNLIVYYTESEDNYGLANTYSRLGSLYFTMHNPDKANEYIAKASELFKLIKNYKPKQSDNYIPDDNETIDETETIAENKIDNLKKTSKELEKAYKIVKIGNIYKESDNFKEAKIFYLKAFKILKKENNYQELASVIVSLADIELSENNDKKAKKYYLEALELSLKYDLKIALMESYKGLSIVLGNQKKYENAYENYKNYISVRDLIYDEKKNNEIQSIKANKELENQKLSNELLLKQELVNKITLEKNQILLVAMVACIVILLLLVCFFIIQYKNKKNINNVLASKNQNLQKMIKELKSSETQLEELVHTKNQFFSIISHDLKEPINSMKGYLNLAQNFPDTFTPKDIKDFAFRMDIAVKNLSQLLNNLLEWAMVQTGAIQTKIEKIDIDQIISKKIELFAPQIETKNITIKYISHKELCAVADQNMIEFAVRNLLHNAIKFTKIDGEIEIETTALNHKLQIKIKDSGVGIGKDALTCLFNTDRRFTNVGTNSEKGTGLGLILCKDFITRNSGTLSVESILGEGSCFTVELNKYEEV